MIVLTTYRPSDFLGTNDSHPQSSKVPGSNFHLSRPLHRSPTIKEPLASRILDHRSPTATTNDNASHLPGTSPPLLPPTTNHQGPRFPIACVDNVLKTRNCNLHCDNLPKPLTCDKWNEGAIMAPEMAWRSPSRGQPGCQDVAVHLLYIHVCLLREDPFCVIAMAITDFFDAMMPLVC